MTIAYWIIALLVSAAIGYWVYLADKKKNVPYPLVTSVLRALVVFITAVLLFAPAITIQQNETQKPILLFLQDNSASIPFALKNDSSTYRRDAADLLSKLEKDYKVVRWGFGNTIQKDTLFNYAQQATDIAHAMEQATEMYGQQNLGAILLATDGRFNQGLNPQFQDLAMKGVVYTVALGDSTIPKDIRVANVYANKTVMLNSQFEIRADVVANKLQGFNGSVQLKDEEGNIKASTALNISSDHFDRGVSFTVKAEKEGLHHYTINIPAADGEENIANNRKEIFVEVVSEKKKIIIVAAAPHPDVNAIREALSSVENYEVTIATPDKLPVSLAAYQVVVLHNLPSQNILLQQQQNTIKALWLIMGSGANNILYNQWQNLAQLNVNAFNLQNLFATPNTSFNAFTLPNGLSAVMDKMPPLAVPAGLIQAKPGAQILCTQKGNANIPLWLLSQGSKPTALLLGEGIWRWRLMEYRQNKNHNVVDELIRQTAAFLAANVNEKPFTVSLPKYSWSDREPINFNAYLLNESNEQINTPDAQIVLTDNNGKAQSYSFEKMGNAYRLNIGLRAEGTYHFVAKTNFNGKEFPTNGSFVVQTQPLEMMETGADYPLLHAVATKYGGALVPASAVSSLYDSIKKNPTIKPLIQTLTTSIPLIDWKWYFLIILLLAVAEWLLRKYWMAM
jgi:hypothetical protein